MQYHCKDCRKYFSIDYTKKEKLWIKYIDGLSVRKLADQLGTTKSQTQRQLNTELDSLPENTYLSSTLCDPRKWSGTAIVDGKYVKVKRYKKKIPFIYLVDYETHDIVCGVLAPSENTHVFMKLFRLAKTVNYPLELLVTDNVLETIGYPAKYHYKGVKIQLCLNHYVENLRKILKVRSDTTYSVFFEEVVSLLRKREETRKQKHHRWKHIFGAFVDDPLLEQIMLDIHAKRDFLFLYTHYSELPQSNNLIELFNSHLEGRLKTIKGFNSFTNAERFLNAWMVRRRTLPFTDCSARFSFLNGTTSLSQVVREDGDLDDFMKKLRS